MSHIQTIVFTFKFGMLKQIKLSCRRPPSKGCVRNSQPPSVTQPRGFRKASTPRARDLTNAHCEGGNVVGLAGCFPQQAVLLMENIMLHLDKPIINNKLYV